MFGYDVNGQVTSEGDPVVGVSFLLFGVNLNLKKIENLTCSLN